MVLWVSPPLPSIPHRWAPIPLPAFHKVEQKDQESQGLTQATHSATRVLHESQKLLGVHLGRKLRMRVYGLTRQVRELSAQKEGKKAH